MFRFVAMGLRYNFAFLHFFLGSFSQKKQSKPKMLAKDLAKIDQITKFAGLVWFFYLKLLIEKNPNVQICSDGSKVLIFFSTFFFRQFQLEKIVKTKIFGYICFREWAKIDQILLRFLAKLVQCPKFAQNFASFFPK